MTATAHDDLVPFMFLRFRILPVKPHDVGLSILIDLEMSALAYM